jgi:proline iminopeptidase
MKFLALLFLIISNEVLPQQVKSFANKDVQLYYKEKGKGPALYILAGGPGAPPNEHDWWIDSLEKHYTVVLLHQRGSGESRNIPINKNTINIKAYTSDIDALRQHRNDKQISLIGISWGGLLAMNYAVSYPKHVNKLVLIGSAPPTYKEWHVLADNQYARFSIAERDSMQMLLKIFSTKAPVELEQLKAQNPAATEVQAFKRFVHILHRVHFYERSLADENFDSLFYNFNFAPISIIDEEVMNTKWDITSELKKIKIPTLILYGRQDDQGEYNFILQHQLLKKSKLQVIEQAGHFIWEDQPQAFYEALKGYLLKK